MKCAVCAGEVAPDGFDYMQAEDQQRADEAAAQAYVATLLQQSDLAGFLPVIQDMAAAPALPLCMRVGLTCLSHCGPMHFACCSHHPFLYRLRSSVCFPGAGPLANGFL